MTRLSAQRKLLPERAGDACHEACRLIQFLQYPTLLNMQLYVSLHLMRRLRCLADALRI
ncbi:hypothetical protein D3C77_410550 [compost metagenome]